MSPQKIVVVGAGMVGHRFVDELVRADRTGRYAVELIGAESYEPYNRILLSEVVAGRADLKALSLPLPDSERVTFRRGCAAVGLDLAERRVLLDDGSASSFDRLVLATGATAFVPPIEGLESGPRHVHVLRTLDDCRNIAARAMNAKHAVVLGGGVLGLEAACGLRRRGVPVTVIDLDEHLMATQLDGPPARMLAGRLRDLGIDVITRSSISEVISAYDEIVAVRLADGRLLAADLMLVSCGVRAEAGLAAAAGLAVERGIVVDADLTTADPQVHAIGDCAQAPAGMTGLLAPGWAQAERLVELLVRGVGADVDLPTASAEPVRLKAAGVDLVTMGVRPSAARDDDRLVTLTDSGGRRHVDLVIREDALVGVTCLGAPEISAALSVAYDRRTPLPLDPLTMLVPEARTEESTSPVRMPGSTTVCRCSSVTKKEIVTAWEQGARSADAVAATTRASTGCGGCRDVVCGLVDWLNASDPGVDPGADPDAGPPSRSTPVTQRNTTVESTT
ncbi:NAD(P)/FAD-dependent oxidoreductase [Nocardioides marmoriginsengisoli]|uniref:NAD(P)/FAD-dependent oxidoreductase n=1 Tax=Nocardioides marmoriginsengisoli TaxID=661483 RepID=A0A3N0CII9_9ACTN|nr:FAD-dependent oxidoreductase [Nocardioides marmoriginsengisoli]RNL63262.1 NAD(P)/FAD-dependent oxidoreductase [Nocardioides marmoriginsengisoli]